MSALGQKQTFAAHQPMSALPPKADMCSALADVCFGPKADIGLFSSFDKKTPASKPELFREDDEIGLDSGFIAQGIVRDDKCGAYRQ